MILSPNEHISLVAVQELTTWATFDGSDIKGWTVNEIAQAGSVILARIR